MADERRPTSIRWRALRALWPRSAWARAALIVVPVLLVLAVVAPFMSAAGGLVEFATRVVAPLIETATGRLLLLNGLLIGLGVAAFFALRGRFRELRSGLRLRAHLDGIAALVEGDLGTANDRLRRAARSRAIPPRDLPEIGAHARLGLARLALDAGDADRAMRWLAEVRGADLPDELRRSSVQLRFQALELQGEALPEEVERDLRDALSGFPDDVVQLRRLREILRARGALDEAVEVQGRIVDAAPPADTAAERARLARDLVLAGRAALRAGVDAVDVALERADAARQADADGAGPHLLRGDALRVRGDVRASLRAYAQAADGEGLARAAALLEAFPDALTPREVLEAFPLDGGILLVARAHAHRGEDRAAERAARLALRSLAAHAGYRGAGKLLAQEESGG